MLTLAGDCVFCLKPVRTEEWPRLLQVSLFFVLSLFTVLVWGVVAFVSPQMLARVDGNSMVFSI